MDKTVNLGEYLVSVDESESLRTYGLATCVGVVAYSSRCRLMAMAHVVLPGMPPAHMAGLNQETVVFLK